VKEKQSLECFFMPGERGKLFSIFYPPLNAEKSIGGILYIHPFAEEMNKSRRMTSLQAREFTKLGYAVLVIDLYGCGDSEGELINASWNLWVRDLLKALEWLEKHCDGKIILWGLRLGALLSLQLAEETKIKIDQVILWQPTLNGSIALTEFLRITLAGNIISKNGNKITTNDIKQQLFSGKTLELSGYDLNPELAKEINTADILSYELSTFPIHWFEVVRDISQPVSPAINKIIDTWKMKNLDIIHKRVCCENFWSAGDIKECPALIQATCEVVAR